MPELTAELIVDRIAPQQPQVTADGRLVAWAAVPASRREEHALSAVWCAECGRAGSVRQLTAGLAEDRAPRWSPDGCWLYFLSDRAERGVAHLYRIRPGGGEAEPLTTGRAAVCDFTPLPDGRRIAFTQADDTRDEDERRTRERDDAQVWGERWPRRRLRLLDVETGQVETVALGERHVAGLTTSHDGTWLAVALWPTPEINNAWHGSDLALVPAGGDPGAIRELGRWTCQPESLRFAPDDRALLYIGPEAGRRPSSNALWRLPLDGAPARCLTTGLPACVQSFAVAPGAGVVLALIAEGVTSSVRRLAPDAPAPDHGETRYRPAPRGVIDALAVSDDGRTLALVQSAPDRPAEIWTRTADGEPRRLSDHGRPFEGIVWGRQEVVEWQAPDGWTIDGLLVVPPGHAGGRLPLICYVHGGPYGRYADGFNPSWAQWLAAQGWAVLMPNYRGGLGHGHRFAATVSGEIGNADFRDVMAGVDAMIERGVADPDRLAIGGWSQGGFMTAWAVGQTDRFKAAVMGAGVCDWRLMVAESDMTEFELDLAGDAPWDGFGPHRADRQSPISYARRVRTPVLILHGERDERVPASQGRFFGAALRRFNVPVEQVIYPREPHGVRERNHQLDLHRRLVAWYRRWLG